MAFPEKAPESGLIVMGRDLRAVVARVGVEPTTFRFSGGRSYQLSYLAKRSVTPGGSAGTGMLATPTGLEPATSAVTGRRANQLRHGARCDRDSTARPEPHPKRDSASIDRSTDASADRIRPAAR